jgi:hypothetical protein
MGARGVSGFMTVAYVLRHHWVREGGLNSSRWRWIAAHRQAPNAFLSVKPAASRPCKSIQRHPDTCAAGSRAGSQTLLNAARSPPLSQMH